MIPPRTGPTRSRLTRRDLRAFLTNEDRWAARGDWATGHSVLLTRPGDRHAPTPADMNRVIESFCTACTQYRADARLATATSSDREQHAHLSHLLRIVLADGWPWWPLLSDRAQAQVTLQAAAL